MSKIVAVDPGHPAPQIIEPAADMLRRGGLLVFPTRSLYGLGADAFNSQAVARVFSIKRRDPRNPLLVLIDDDQWLDSLVETPGDAARHLMRNFWPGKVTFVLKALKGLPPGLISESGKIGVRLVEHPVALSLVRALGRPLTGTSANLSGTGGCADIHTLDPVLLSAVDQVLDCGMLMGGAGSTIVDATVVPPVVLREGSLPAREIIQAYHFFRTG
jgi:L-threonylcarbamoyladenylate synthase